MNNFKMLLDQQCRLDQNRHKQAVMVSTQGSHADIYLYGVVGGSEVNLSRFKRALDAAGKVDTLTVYLNTIGGSFEDGLPIHNELAQHPATVTIKIMGYALSIGSVIMLAGDHIECAENGLIMLHRAQSFTYGDADEHGKSKAALERHEAAIMPAYARRLGLSVPAVFELLKAETWYTAQDALDAGLIDSITGAADLAEAELQSGLDTEGDKFLQHYRRKPHNWRWANGWPAAAGYYS